MSIFGNIIAIGDSGSSISPVLPDTYQQVEYIETTDYQYCEIPYQINAGDIIAGEVSLSSGTSESGFAGRYPNGWELSFNSSKIVNFWVSSNSGSSNLGLAVYPTVTSSSVNTKFRFAISFSATIQTNYVNVGVYRSDSYPFNGKIYHFAIISNGLGLQNSIDLIPCYRKADNEPGLYDLINGIFYTNQGDGAFTAGPNVA